MQSVHACAVQTHFSVFVFFLKKGSFGLPFWSILEALGALLAPRGCPGWFWRSLKKRSKKEVLRNHARPMSKVGVPIGIALGIALGRALGRDLGIELEIGSNLEPQDFEDRD